MDSVYRPRYLAFRDASMSVADSEALRSSIKNLILGGARGFREIALGPGSRHFKIYIYVSRPLNMLFFLGGHLERLGEPKLGYLDDLEAEVELIQEEERHGH